jgi:hypothetical protein
MFCAANNKTCGAYTGKDRCGNDRTAFCGTCGTNLTCGGAGTPNVCGCVSESDAVFCQHIGKSCDGWKGTDNCGKTRTASCGTCPGGQVCSYNNIPGICSGCVAETDAAFCGRFGLNCGAVKGTDNCGAPRQANCGSCTGSSFCGGGGTPAVCGCTPESDADFCASLGASCGTQTAQDNCGVSRTRNCGTCQAPASCGGNSVANQCGCKSETNTEFCARLGKNCDVVNAYDSCGVNRSANCGSCTFPQFCAGAGVSNVCGGTASTGGGAGSTGGGSGSTGGGSGSTGGGSGGGFGGGSGGGFGGGSGGGFGGGSGGGFGGGSSGSGGGTITGDTCGTVGVPMPVQFNTSNWISDTSFARNDFNYGDCSDAGVPGTGPDVVYKFFLDAGQSLTNVVIDGCGPMTSFLVNECPIFSPTVYQCGGTKGPTQSNITLTPDGPPPPGTYYVIVDTSAGNTLGCSKALDVTVTVAP